MYYVRNSAGGMLAITPKSSTVIAVKKPSAVKSSKATSRKSRKIKK